MINNELRNLVAQATLSVPKLSEQLFKIEQRLKELAKKTCKTNVQLSKLIRKSKS
jgi:hypothetical protein